MGTLETISALGAKLVSNRAIVRIKGEAIVVAQVSGTEWVLTEQGQALAADVKPIEKPTPAPKEKKTFLKKKTPSKKRVRARNSDGTLKGDDPSTPDVNEAWVDGDS